MTLNHVNDFFKGYSSRILTSGRDQLPTLFFTALGLSSEGLSDFVFLTIGFSTSAFFFNDRFFLFEPHLPNTIGHRHQKPIGFNLHGFDTQIHFDR